MKTIIKNDHYLDFETTPQVNYEKEGRTRVFSWVLKDDEGNKSKGIILREAMWRLESIDYRSRVWVYNLGFEGSFIEDWLLENGYKQVLQLKKLKDNEYRIIRKNGQWYAIAFANITLVDAGNFVAGGLDKFAETFAPELPKYHMKDEWYKQYRPIDYWPNDKEWEYNENDVEILRVGVPRFFEKMKSLVDEFLGEGSFDDLKLDRKLTISSIAYNVLKASVPNFNKLFPKTTQNDFKHMVDAYVGGYVFARPIKDNLPNEVKNNIENDYYVKIYSQDIKSSYPKSYGYEIMPYGTPIRYFNGDIEHAPQKLKIYHVKAKYDLKEGFVPIIGGNHLSYVKATYHASSNGEYVEFKTTNIDFEFMKRYYDIDYEIMGGMAFNTFKENPFKKYVDFWYAVKERAKAQGDKVMGEIAKLMLNSPYGKTAMNGERIDVLKYFLDGEIKSTNVHTLNPEGYEYLPLAIFITAYSRARLWLGAEQIGWNKVVYTDTDSVKSVEPLPNLGKNLGDFEHEYIADYFKVLAPKRYNTIVNIGNGKYKIDIKAAGFGKKVLKREFGHCDKKETRDIQTALYSINKFKSGLTIPLDQFKRVKGGRVAIAMTKDFI